MLPLIAMDRYDPEPVWLLALLFGWGALVAVIVSFVVNTVFGIVMYVGTHSEGLADLLGAVISAPIIEEGTKGLGVLAALLFFRKYFDDILDGIIFAGVIALGFATVENVLYYGRQINDFVMSQPGLEREQALKGLIVIFILRGIMSPFAHVTFTSMTGIGCGIARESHNKAIRVVAPILGYFGAVTLHAIWNGMAVIGGGKGFFYGDFLGEIPLFLIFVRFSPYIMR